jgi:ubiquinone/menaquinone biosynthesis C-methylase UbiE
MKEALLEPLLRRMRLQKVISHIPQNSKVLDIGCGRKATLLKTIAPTIQHGVGIDFKVEPVVITNVKTLQLRLDGNLPFEDNYFDIVTMLAVLEHIEHEQSILHEIYRVLKPTGRLVLTVPSIWAQPVLEFLSYRLKIIDEAEIRDHKRYYNCQKLNDVLIQKSGFRDFSHQYFQLWMNNFCTVVK